MITINFDRSTVKFICWKAWFESGTTWCTGQVASAYIGGQDTLPARWYRLMTLSVGCARTQACRLLIQFDDDDEVTPPRTRTPRIDRWWSVGMRPGRRCVYRFVNWLACSRRTSRSTDTKLLNYPLHAAGVAVSASATARPGWQWTDRVRIQAKEKITFGNASPDTPEPCIVWSGGAWRQQLKYWHVSLKGNLSTVGTRVTHDPGGNEGLEFCERSSSGLYSEWQLSNSL